MDPKRMQLTDWLDDLSVRFIVNLPREELESVERICFQVEEAQWFYEDFVRPLDPNLPSLSLRQFSMKIFQHCPLFSIYDADVHSKAFSEFLAYKTRVPVRGAILLNEDLDQVILVKGWKKGANWSFPRGKINKDERDIDCAIREVYEETGYDVRAEGLAGTGDDAKFIEVTMREQHMKLFVFARVPMDTHFEPRTRKEISQIQWYRISDLPTFKKTKHQQHNPHESTVNSNKFYMVAPFLGPLKKIISSLRKEHAVQDPLSVGQKPFIGVAPPMGGERPLENLTETREDDMVRLMAQLRQSQQASRETNFPEVTSEESNTRSLSVQLMNMLSAGGSHSVLEESQHNDTVARESKANAMLSVLRAGTGSQPNATQQTTRDHRFGPSTQRGPSPETYNSKLNQTSLPENPSPPTVTFPSLAPQMMPWPQGMHRDGHSVALGSRPYGSGIAPYQRTGDPGFAHSQQTSVKQVSVVPPASRLPPPRLTQQKSDLLSLFKASDRSDIPANQHPAERTEPQRQELSVSSPTNASYGQTPLVSNIQSQPQMLSSTPALVAPLASSSRDSNSKRSSHQESLLNLFRQPKPSPSLVPPEAPVELSAQGSPTNSRVPSKHIKTSGSQKPRPKGQPKTRLETTAETRPSATVSGPLNVPQFEILRRPKDPLATTKKPQQEDAPSTVLKHVRILTRPPVQDDSQGLGSKPARTGAAGVDNASELQHGRSQPLPFQPQILKRPTPKSQAASPPSASRAEPVDIAKRDEEKPSDSNKDQKAALLSLFGKPADTSKSPLPGPTTSMVSPLSEKPGFNSELPSPMGFARSRLGSLQDGTSSQDAGRSSAASAGDKKFLLGFLDGVVRKGS